MELGQLSNSPAASYACNSIHYTHRKLIVHILIDFDEAEVECSVVCCATAIDQGHVCRDLEKYTNYEDTVLYR